MNRTSTSRFEQFFLTLSFLLLSGGFFSTVRMLRQVEVPLGDQDPWNTVSNFLVYSVALVLCAAHFSRVKPLLSTVWQIPTICAYVTLSILWSDAPEISVRRVIAMILGVVFAYYVASRFSIQAIVLSLSRSFMIIAVLSYAVIFLMPELGRMGAAFDYAWRGVYAHKNILGQAAIVALLTHTYVIATQRQERLLQAAFVALWICLLLQSRSLTSFVVLLVVIAAAALVRILKSRNEQYFALLYIMTLVSFLIFVLLFMNLESVLIAFDRDLTLTGRTTLWSVVLPIVGERPLFGYGYGGFWNLDNPSVLLVWETVGWQQSQAHNGLLDLLLQVGVIGVALVFWLIVRTFISSVELLRRGGFPGADYCCLIVVFLMTNSVTEYMFLRANNIYWILFTTLSIAVVTASQQSNRRTSLKKQRFIGLRSRTN